MPIALILTAVWLAVMLLVVAVCRMAARGDRALHVDERLDGQWRDDLLTPVDLRPTASRYSAYRVPTVPDAGLQPAASDYVGNRAKQDLDVGP